MTEWRTCPGFPSYEVSELGEVRRRSQGRCRFQKPGRPMRVNGKRYLRVNLCRDGKAIGVQVHRLVLLAFVGPPPTDRHHGAHFDGDMHNNRLENLRWASPAENCQDRIRHGRQTRGEHHPSAVLSFNDVLEIRATLAAGGGRFPYGTRIGFCRRFGVSEPTIRAAALGHTWKSAA